MREAVEAIGAAQKERLEALDICPDDILALLDGLLRTAADVEVAAVRMASRAERLHGYLSRKDLGFVRRTAHAAQQSAEKARTLCEQENYQAAARTHEIEVQTLESIEMGLRVTLAKLENIRATLAALPPRIVKLQATSADMGDTSYMRLSDDLRNAHGELDEVERHLRCLARGGDGEMGGEPERVEPSRVEPGRVEPIRMETGRLEQAHIVQARIEQARIEQARIEHGRVEHERIAAARRDIRIAMTPAMPGAEAVDLEEASVRDLRAVNRLMY